MKISASWIEAAMLGAGLCGIIGLIWLASIKHTPKPALPCPLATVGESRQDMERDCRLYDALGAWLNNPAERER